MKEAFNFFVIGRIEIMIFDELLELINLGSFKRNLRSVILQLESLPQVFRLIYSACGQRKTKYSKEIEDSKYEQVKKSLIQMQGHIDQERRREAHRQPDKQKPTETSLDSQGEAWD